MQFPIPTIESFLEPKWSELDKLRSIVGNFFEKNQIEEEHFSPIYMVATELVENGIKYGDFSSEYPYISLKLSKKKNKIITEVKNHISENSIQNLHKLNAKIQWIRGFQNPFEAYVESLKEVSGKQLQEGESGLGLVRIAYEGQSLLDFYVDENTNLTIIAEYHY